MEARYTDGKGNTDDEITGLLLAAIFAGHHTSSVTSAWTLIELLRDPAYLARVTRELDATFPSGEPVSYMGLRKAVVTENAVKETLRLHPPLVLLVRVVNDDFVFKGWLVRKGSWIMLSPLVAHRIGSVFPEPMRFDPDRFAPPRAEDKRDFAYIPFGGGRHKCLGNAFALLQVKAILATLVGRFDFELVGDPVRADFHGTVVGPVEPVRVRYVRRKTVTVAASTPVKTNGTARAEAPEASLWIDHDLCQGHGLCVNEAPEVFRLGADGKAELVTTSPDEAVRDRVRLAHRHCPTHAIRFRA
jgi:sterol 14-demethylase